MIFHLNPTLFPAGFIGVDIFFVISGFLITSIIYSDLSAGKFTLKGFYLKRMKRILPAYNTVLVATLLLAFFIAPPEKLVSLAHSALSTVIFASNFFFGFTKDYFDSALWDDPLLHTWSLAVEEQFYIVWPILLILVARYRLRLGLLIGATVLLAIVSFLIAEWMLGYTYASRWAYYLLPPRAGELLGGALAAFVVARIQQRKLNTVAALVGVIVIALGFILIDEGSPFPGFNALYPTIGTLLIILFATANEPVGWFFSRPLLVFIGKLSYSLYLWHWPILALTRMAYGQNELSLTMQIVCLVVIVALSYLTWRCVENPIRKKTWGFGRATLITYMAPSLLVGGLVAGFVMTNGVTQRYQDPNVLSALTFHDQKFCHNNTDGSCRFGRATEPANVLMFGDSHAGHFSPFMDELADQLGIGVEIVSVDACYPLLDTKSTQVSADPSLFEPQACKALLDDVGDRWQSFQTIVLAGAWNSYMQGDAEPHSFDFRVALESTVKVLAEGQQKVVILAQVPAFQGRSVERFLSVYTSPFQLNSVLFGGDSIRFSIDQSVAETNSYLKHLAESYAGVTYVDPLASIPDSLPQMENGMFAYKDSNHLNAKASRQVARQLFKGDEEFWRVLLSNTNE